MNTFHAAKGDVIGHGILNLTKGLIFLGLGFLLILLVLGRETTAPDDRLVRTVFTPDGKETSGKKRRQCGLQCSSFPTFYRAFWRGRAPAATATEIDDKD